MKAVLKNARNASKHLQNAKLSPINTSDALFRESLQKIRQSKPLDLYYAPSAEIEKLSADEIQITKTVFARVDPNKEVIPQISHRNHFIDPYWDPFKKVNDLSSELESTLDEYSKLVSVAEHREQRMRTRIDLKRSFALANPYSKESQAQYNKATLLAPPEPLFKPESFWQPSLHWRQLLSRKNRWLTFRGKFHFIRTLVRNLGRTIGRGLICSVDRDNSRHHVRGDVRNSLAFFATRSHCSHFVRITVSVVLRCFFLDIDVISHFVSESGFILPRRVTCATRRQQVAVFKSISLARSLALMPYDWQTPQVDAVELMDPLQYMVNELLEKSQGGIRNRWSAMLQVMKKKYPNLDYRPLSERIRRKKPFVASEETAA